MSFRINTNASALNALTNVNRTQAAVQQSIQRLSTGLRINSAADDPAGLIAAKKFQAQIGGLNQAISNSQDGINYAQTAEGALDEVNNLLNDARSLAVQSANTATLSSSQLQANQSQLASIVSSINRISANTQYGNKNLLDGSAGVVATVTNTSKVALLNIGGTFGGASVTQTGGVGVQVTAAATKAQVLSQAYAFGTSLAANAGYFTLNGVTFNIAASDTAQGIVDKINAAQGTTGVTALYDATNTRIELDTTKYGSGQSINLTDSSAVIKASAGAYTAAGTDATATLTINTKTALFTGSKNGTDGLTLTDADGNTIGLTVTGNAVAANATLGQVTVGSAQFQVGANANQTASLSISSFAASQLGTGVAANVNLTTLDMTTSSGANQAIQVIDAAIDQVAKSRGDIGNFQRNVLQANVQSLGVAAQNLSASLSNIQDTDVASETTNLTKQQIILQAGLAVLAQANSSPQAVLKLLQ